LPSGAGVYGGVVEWLLDPPAVTLYSSSICKSQGVGEGALVCLLGACGERNLECLHT